MHWSQALDLSQTEENFSYSGEPVHIPILTADGTKVL